MKKILFLCSVLFLTGCNPMDDTSPINGTNTLNQEECECRGGDYAKTGSGAVGSVVVPRYKCFKDDEELYRVYRDETCEKYWHLQNNKIEFKTNE